MTTKNDHAVVIRSSKQENFSVSQNSFTTLIADDHALVAQALGEALKQTGGFDYIVVETAEDALKILSENNSIDIILLDIQMPGMRGIASIETFVRRAPDTKVVLFSGKMDTNFLNKALGAGASGFIPKSMGLRAMASALTMIQHGETYVPFTQSASGDTNFSSREKTSSLTGQEKRILELTADGYTNKEIAIELSTTEVSIKMAMRAICKKLDAKNRTHAVVISHHLDLI